MRQECLSHSAHLQSCLLLGCNVLLLGVIPEVLVKRGPRERNAERGISVTWQFKAQTSLLLNPVFHYIVFIRIKKKKRPSKISLFSFPHCLQ